LSQGAEGLIVVINYHTQTLSCNGQGIEIGHKLVDYFSADVEEQVASVFATNTPQTVKGYRLWGRSIYDIDVTPLSGKFRDKGVILSLKQVGNWLFAGHLSLGQE
jgi:hypothetical protein